MNTFDPFRWLLSPRDRSESVVRMIGRGVCTFNVLYAGITMTSSDKCPAILTMATGRDHI